MPGQERAAGEKHGQLYRLISSKSESLLEIADEIHNRSAGGLSSQGLYTFLAYLSSNLINVLEDHRVFGSGEWRPFYRLAMELYDLCSILTEIISLERICRGSAGKDTVKRLRGDNEKLGLMALELLRNICGELTRESMKLPLNCRIGRADPELFRNDQICDMLPQTSRGQEEILEEDRIVYLAERFLNLAGEYPCLKPPDLKDKEKVSDYIRARLGEEKLETLENRAVHLKKLFEKYVNFKVTASRGEDLKDLHRRISQICCLTRLGYLIIGFNRSHSFLMDGARLGDYTTKENGFSPENYSWFITSFAFYYIDVLLKEGAALCREILGDYLREGELSLPVPPYRGFHVRPSTLISRIIRHYGSEMAMIHDGETYDPASPMDLFRANERISRKARRELKEELIEALSPKGEAGESARGGELFRKAVSLLHRRGRIHISDMDIILESREGNGSAGTYAELVNETAAKVETLIMEEKIHLLLTEKVLFRGDDRVLKDLKLLADGGYGEDREGKNTPLPDGLSYLNREWSGA